MLKGKVKWYNFEKGYGFIKGENSKEYFFHWTWVMEDAVAHKNRYGEFFLPKGTEVKFLITESHKENSQAVFVKVLKKRKKPIRKKRSE